MFIYLLIDIHFYCLPGIDFKIKTVELRGKKIKLQIWVRKKEVYFIM